MLNWQNNEELNEILNFNGNEEEFEKYHQILNESFDSLTIYYDKEEKQKKYTGKLKNNIYEGRGILYNISGEIIYDGYFKDGKYDGFGKLYDSNELIYEGFFNGGYYCGKGISYKNEKKKFNGYFICGHYNGVGIQYLSNGKKLRKMKYEKGKPSKDCYGVLYDDNGREIYQGKLKNGIPENAKLVTIYDSEENYVYIGDFYSFKYHGEGTIFFEKNNKFFFKGNLREGELINGILYDLEGNPTYEGSFMNNIPKEGKNIKLYKLNTILIYEGDIFNYKYNGYGKLYTEKDNKLKYDGNFKDGEYDGFGKLYNYDYEYDIYYLYYEGNFLNGHFEGKGIQYYSTGEKYYEGNYKNNKFFSLGIRYYKNKAIKIKGNFNDNCHCEGEYFNPENKLLYNGTLINEIPLNSSKIIIYNDEAYIIYKGKIKNGKYSEEGIEYSDFIKDMILYKGYFSDNNYAYLNEPNKNIINKKEPKIIKAVIIGSTGNDGKTSLFIRLFEDTFRSNKLAIGIDYRLLSYEYNKKNIKLQIWDFAGQERFRSSTLPFLKGANIILFVFNLCDENSIDIQYFNQLFNSINKKKIKFIYLIGTKSDITKKYAFNYRKLAKSFFEEGKINKYFEVSSKSGEGIKKLKNILKIDAAKITDDLQENTINENYHLFNPYIIGFDKNNTIFNKLNKYLSK